MTQHNTLAHNITTALEALRPVDPDLVSDALSLLEEFLAEGRGADSATLVVRDAVQ